MGDDAGEEAVSSPSEGVMTVGVFYPDSLQDCEDVQSESEHCDLTGQ